ncbi:MAG: DNA topoisomerase III, partial [Saezia sp.]
EATELVIATDADREGEMIARELVDFCGYKGKINRLWLSALNEASIRKALSELKPGAETQSMYYSALTRSRSDWLIGMNLSRLFTLLGKQAGYEGVLSVGRVQTPTLSLVVRRDREIANFKPVPFWAIDATLQSDGSTFFISSWIPPEESTDDAGRCIHVNAAKNALVKIQGTGIAQVVSVETERIKEGPPLVFDLGTLQEICSRKFGFGAQETLDIAQALYETHKATTYPRSDCGYLPESMIADIPTVIAALTKTDPAIGALVGKLDTSIRSRVWNDKKITAHHGIIPTLEPANLSAMSEKELAAYKLIRSYYLAQFLPHHEFDRTIANLSCADQHLKATGKQIIVQGWRSVLVEDAETEGDIKSQVLPKLAQGMSCKIVEAQMKALKTLPPKSYTEGELVKAMKTIARLVTDLRLKQILKETTGIGTEATRAGIIKGLLQRGYLVTKNKAVKATDAAFALIDAVPAAIVDPGMTAVWEQALDSIEKGEMQMDQFIQKQTAWISQLIEQYRGTQLNVKVPASPACP